MYVDFLRVILDFVFFTMVWYDLDCSCMQCNHHGKAATKGRRRQSLTKSAIIAIQYTVFGGTCPSGEIGLRANDESEHREREVLSNFLTIP